MHWTSSDWGHTITFGVTTQSLTGQTVCQTGATTTGLTGDLNISGRCGIVTAMTALNPCSGPSFPWTTSFGQANYMRGGGDSGAAVVWPTYYGYGAAGIHSCQGNTENSGTFTRYSVIANTWGLTLSPS